MMAAPDLDDIDILARTIWGEARGESKDGWHAVADVVINRAEDPRWPDKIADVCKQPWQFSCWNDNDPNREKLLEIGLHDSLFLQIYAVAAEALATPIDITGGANHYCTTALLRSNPPFWAKGHEPVRVIGRHAFFRL